MFSPNVEAGLVPARPEAESASNGIAPAEFHPIQQRERAVNKAAALSTKGRLVFAKKRQQILRLPLPNMALAQTENLVSQTLFKLL